MYNQNITQVKNEIKSSIDILENLTGKKVESFRAPGFSINQNNKWIFEILHENGIKYDSSIFPAVRSHGGFENFPFSKPFKIISDNFELKEFPINTFNFFNFNLVFSGGGYFRILPFFLLKYFSNKSDYIMSYFHPRDFDKYQPMIKDLSLLRKFKSYIGIGGCKKKLEKWLDYYSFIDINQANKRIDWVNTKIYKL